jgi:hypothetical protein
MHTSISMACSPTIDSRGLLKKNAHHLIRKRQNDENVGLLKKALSLIKITKVSTLDSHAIALDWEPDHWEPDHSYSTASHSPTKGPLSPSKRQQKRVMFDTRVNVRKALHIYDYSDYEVQVCWYDVDENKAIRKDAKFAVSLLKDGKLEEDNECYCRRGLELHTQTSAGDRRLQNKRDAREAVLTEQELQWEEYVDDPGYIAMLCIDYSSSSIAIAHATGLRDQLDAMP